jgi:hypothetical protein
MNMFTPHYFDQNENFMKQKLLEANVKPTGDCWVLTINGEEKKLKDDL